jgi:tetratricopeptide (TPR) repeat protein
VRYEAFNNGWRAFDYVFYVVYPPEREQELYAALGDWGDPNWAYERALEIADEEVQTMDGLDQYFAWFNKGTSAVNLLQYGEAAEAYDRAFEIYPTLPEEAEGIDSYRPYRMMWYQTGPYKAYYYTGRYQDVIDLANTTLFSIVSAAELEESFYWRGLAKEALGDHVGAASDLRTALHYNKNFTAAYDALAQIQAGP